jgi:signal transduction histidine kinase
MQSLAWFFLGLGCGVGAMVPLAMWAARRTAQRVRRLEQRARASERLAELGTMTGGLAHEIRNPLSTIGLNLQLLRESVDDAGMDDAVAGRLRRRIDALSSEADRLRAILEDFLRFAGRLQLDFHTVHLNHLIEQLADFYQPQAAASGVQLRCQLSPDDVTVHVDTTLLKQAVLNLLINATQAMVTARYAEQPHGGAADLIIRTEHHGDIAIVHVIDTGPGIPDDMREKVFQPYYSTKKGGTGLGLAITRRIVEEHDGSIAVHSEAGRGTDFTITLPVACESPDASADDEPSAAGA